MSVDARATQCTYVMSLDWKKWNYNYSDNEKEIVFLIKDKCRICNSSVEKSQCFKKFQNNTHKIHWLSGWLWNLAEKSTNSKFSHKVNNMKPGTKSKAATLDWLVVNTDKTKFWTLKKIEALPLHLKNIKEILCIELWCVSRMMNQQCYC